MESFGGCSTTQGRKPAPRPEDDPLPYRRPLALESLLALPWIYLPGEWLHASYSLHALIPLTGTESRRPLASKLNRGARIPFENPAARQCHECFSRVVALLALFLRSPRPRYITGELTYIDGATKRFAR